MDEQQQAAQALASVRDHQDRARRAARLPLWVYAVMFVLAAGGMAANDFVNLTGATFMAAIILVALVAALVIGFVGRSAPLSRLRGVQGRQQFSPRAFGAIVIICGAGLWLLVRYGSHLAQTIANAIGLPHYPYTVLGIIYGIVFTAVFALGQYLTARQAAR